MVGKLTVAPSRFRLAVERVLEVYPDHLTVVEDPKTLKAGRTFWSTVSLGSAAICLPIAIFTLSPVLAIPAIGGTIGLFKLYGRRELYRYQLKRLSDGDKPFILYLRGFRLDTDRRDPGGASQIEVDLVSKFAGLVSFVAIDNPRDPGFSGGAVRLRASNEAWRCAVDELSREADGVLIDLRDSTPGLVEEVRRHLDAEQRLSSNVMFLMRDIRGRPPKEKLDLDEFASSVVEPNELIKQLGWLPAYYTLRDGSLVVTRAERGFSGDYKKAMKEFVLDVFKKRTKAASLSNAERSLDQGSVTASNP
jgi:hypothetical protein